MEKKKINNMRVRQFRFAELRKRCHTMAKIDGTVHPGPNTLMLLLLHSLTDSKRGKSRYKGFWPSKYI